MRDDVKALVASLITLHEEKLALLGDILHSHMEKRHLLKTDSIGEINDLIEIDSIRAESIDALEADITFAREKICSLCGIPDTDFDHYFLKGNGWGSGELMRVSGEIKTVLRRLTSENDTLQRELDSALKRTGWDIDGLRRLIDLGTRIKGPGNGN